MVELKPHAGWNTCKPSLLLGFAFCRHIHFKRPLFFISSAWLVHAPMIQHIHTSHVTPIHITFYFFSGHNCISPKMAACLLRLMLSTVCSYPMVSSTWSCPKASMSLMCYSRSNWTVCCMYWTGVSGVGSTGAVGANAAIYLSEGPMRLHYNTIHCTQIQSVIHWEGYKDSAN